VKRLSRRKRGKTLIKGKALDREADRRERKTENPEERTKRGSNAGFKQESKRYPGG